MTMALATIQNTSLESHKGIINIDLIAQWLKFADVSEKSVKTYNKAIRRFFVYLNEQVSRHQRLIIFMSGVIL